MSGGSETKTAHVHQGLTLVHFSACRQHFLRDLLGVSLGITENTVHVEPASGRVISPWFEVELFSWTSDKDMFGDGGCVRSKTLKKGHGYTFPKAGGSLRTSTPPTFNRRTESVRCLRVRR